jgi:hypothetical protein
MKKFALFFSVLLTAVAMLFGSCKKENPAPSSNSSPPADVTKPTLTLIGPAHQSMHVGSTYIDPGATAHDNVDGDITSRIQKSYDQSCNTTAGLYFETYWVADNAGNMTMDTVRQINVYNVSIPGLTLIGPDTIRCTRSTTYVEQWCQYSSIYQQWQGTLADYSAAQVNAMMQNPNIHKIDIGYVAYDVNQDESYKIYRTVVLID